MGTGISDPDRSLPGVRVPEAAPLEEGEDTRFIRCHWRQGAGNEFETGLPSVAFGHLRNGAALPGPRPDAWWRVVSRRATGCPANFPPPPGVQPGGEVIHSLVNSCSGLYGKAEHQIFWV